MNKEIYESIRPLIVVLGITELMWMSYWLLRSNNYGLGFLVTVAVWVLTMLAWMVWVVRAGRHGFYLKHTRWLSNFIGVNLVFLFGILLFRFASGGWEGLTNAAATATNRELASIHILRLLAVGTAIKYLQRQLPLHFLILGSIPDFLFAISAVVVTMLLGEHTLSREFLIAWHTTGMIVFFGALSMFFTVPSPLYIWHTEPDASITFKFPMLLAPNFTVPLFMLAHAFALVKLMA
ncbi:MAG: hypothetical protein PHO76_02845 [Methylotenera sp.]|nr:hypothetical protein [Methylotenera sp.]MDD4927292.1 hypothetical protein [Methylotenera sp.]